MASSYPLLPGFAPTQDINRPNYKKVSATKQEENRDYKPELTDYQLPRDQPVQIPNQIRAQHPDYETTTHSTFQHQNEDAIQYQPNFVKLDKHVLRFYGYFKECAVETQIEKERIRVIKIYFFLEDNSVQITETKQLNSGIPQGMFLARQKVLRNDNKTFISIHDFMIGQEVEIYAKRIKIFDCDEYTREFYQNIGTPQGQSQKCPIDNFTDKLINKYAPQKDPFMMDYLEHKLGGGRVKPQKQFLKNDRKVLEFYVQSDNPYVIHFYLADDTIDIREVNFANSGRDPFPKMLKRLNLKIYRQKMPKKFSLNQPGQIYQEDFMTPLDFQPNKRITIYGKVFLILCCDQFTSDFYKQNYNQDFPVRDNQKKDENPSQNLIIPPYNGFGDEQDSLGYVYRLVPKPPKKDFFKWVDNQVNLRFQAKMQTKSQEDKDRRFVIQYFLNDDSLLIYEPAQRNSGIVEGKFLERGKYKKQDGDFFNPYDFTVGKVLQINGYVYEILELDEFTKKWLTENPSN